MTSRTAAFVCGAIVVGSALYYQKTYIRQDVELIRRRLHTASDQLSFALSKQPYATAEARGKEEAYIPSTAPNSMLHRLKRIWREEVVPEWRLRWNRQVANVAQHLTSLEVDVEAFEVRRRSG